MFKSRFELFAAASLAVHGGLFASLFVRGRHAAPTGASSGATPGGAAALGGETFQVPDLEEAAEEAPTTEEPIDLDERDPAPRPAAPDGPDGPERRSHRARANGGPHAAAAKPAPSEPPPLYGAVGDRSAGDLIATFTHVLGSAPSSDTIWDRVPIGFYTQGDVTFVLDPDGSLARTTVNQAAAPAFRAAVERTLPLLQHRLFTARGTVTRLHVVLRVSGELVNHGAFTISSSPWFEVPSGRHVSFSVVER